MTSFDRLLGAHSEAIRNLQETVRSQGAGHVAAIKSTKEELTVELMALTDIVTQQKVVLDGMALELALRARPWKAITTIATSGGAAGAALASFAAWLWDVWHK